MRVVYVSTIERGGPVSHLRQLAPQVAEAGHDVHVICASEPVAETFRRLGVEATVAPISDKRDVRGAAALWTVVGGADVVHTHDRRAGLFARPQGRLRGAAIVHTLHGLPEEIAVRIGRPDAPDPPGVSRARIAWLVHGYLRIESLLSSLGHVVAPSQAMAAYLVRHGFSTGRLHVIPCGVEPRSHNGRVPPRGGALRLGVAASLEYWKGIDVLLRACGRTPTPVRLEIFGDGTLRGELERLAASLGVDAHFHGFVSDMHGALASVDAYVHPSRADTLPVAILEAMAAGLPVIGARTGGIPELVVDHETGLLFEADNPASLADAIDTLAADSGQRERFGRSGWQRVARHFSAKEMTSRVTELYERLCGSST
jgi:glycosyltransferase involved in cell wall biosynthesis